MAGRLIWDQEVVGSIPAIPMVLGRAQIAGNMRSLSCESKNNAGVFLLCGPKGIGHPTSITAHGFLAQSVRAPGS